MSMNNSKKEFNVTITETLRKTVTVEAESLLDAEQMVSADWHKGEYILDADDFVEMEVAAEEVVPEVTNERNMPKYNIIVRCNLEADGETSYRDSFLLTGADISADGGLEVDLTGAFCFNTEFRSRDREIVAVVNNVDDVVAFCNTHNISVPSHCLADKERLFVGACRDYVLDYNLGVLGWEDDLQEDSHKTPLEEQMKKAKSLVANGKEEPDRLLVGQDAHSDR